MASRYTKEQVHAALILYRKLQSLPKVVETLGYPSQGTLAWEHRRIHIQRETTEGDKTLNEHTKTPAGDRFIPLNTVAMRCLKAILNSNLISMIPTNDDDFIFIHWKKKAVKLASHRAFEYRLYHLQDVLGYKVRRSLHDIRRTYATKCYKNCMDIDRLREYMGHTTIEQTRAYIKDSITSEEQARDILEKIC